MNLKEQMNLLSIKDVSTPRQTKNGTVVWRLPIKINYPGNTERFIEVASFKTGYVRNQNCGYSNYQLNKRNFTDEYYPEHEINSDYTYGKKTGKYIKFQTRGCKLIPNEKDRLEYLIAYCLKNYYIKNANQVADGKYVSKWEHEYALARNNNDGIARWRDSEVNDCGHYDRINDLQEKLDAMTEARDYYKNSYDDLEVSSNRAKELESDVHNLENKLATIERIANDRNKWNG